MNRRLSPLLYSFRFSHHGQHSSYHHLVDYVPSTYKVVTIPTKAPPLRFSPRLFAYWLKLNEYRLLPAFASGRRQCVHYLYPENTLFEAHRWTRYSDLVVTWHQPRSYLNALTPPHLARVMAVFKKAAAVVFLSTESKAQHSEFLGKNTKSYVIKHGVDTDFFSFQSSEQKTGPVTIITAGNWLRDHRCWANCVEELLKRNPDVNFKVLCNDANRLRYESCLTRNSPKINFVSHLDDQQLRHFYHEATVAFLPLVDSTANNALVECMASGVPCVVTDLPSTREYSDNAAFFFRNGDEEGAVDAVSNLIHSAELRIRMATAARGKAESELQWPIIAQRHCEAYETLHLKPEAFC